MLRPYQLPARAPARPAACGRCVRPLLDSLARVLCFLSDMRSEDLFQCWQVYKVDYKLHLLVDYSYGYGVIHMLGCLRRKVQRVASRLVTTQAAAHDSSLILHSLVKPTPAAAVNAEQDVARRRWLALVLCRHKYDAAVQRVQFSDACGGGHMGLR